VSCSASLYFYICWLIFLRLNTLFFPQVDLFLLGILLSSIYVLPLCGGYISLKNLWQYFFFNIGIKTVIYKIEDDLFLLAGHSHGFIFFRFQWWFTFAFLALLPLQLLSPAAPAAGSAASGPAPAAIYAYKYICTQYIPKHYTCIESWAVLVCEG
jgi:hypothetical protein